MQNFADQCLDMASSILEHNLNSINEDGTVSPANDEVSHFDESGHAAVAIGEFFRATGEAFLKENDLVDLAARCITAQAFTETPNEAGLAYSSLGLLSFGPAKSRNIVWERLFDQTKEILDKRLLSRTDCKGYHQAFNIAKAVARYSMGLSKKDETGKLIDKFLSRIDETSSTKFCDSSTVEQQGVFDINGISSFIFIRQALQLHSNFSMKERKLPSLRTYVEKYLKLLPTLVRLDGIGWTVGSGTGAYGQMFCISMILQAMRDEWIPLDQQTVYLDVLKRLFHFFFQSYLDQEHGFLVIRDEQRDTTPRHTTRCSNFDAARYLCQWSRLAKTLRLSIQTKPKLTQTAGKFISFNKEKNKEQGLFLYNCNKTGLHLQIPLITPTEKNSSDSLAFPHAPGIFDWPSNQYLPILLPEMTFGEKICTPSFFAKNCTMGIGLKNSYYFKYEQPNLVTTDAEITENIASCKVHWTFREGTINCEFIYEVKQKTQLDHLRYVVAIGSPHSHYHSKNTFMLGEEGLRASVTKDDFHTQWQKVQTVTEDLKYRSPYGKIHYLQSLERDHPLIMRPGKKYHLAFQFEPDITFVD